MINDTNYYNVFKAMTMGCIHEQQESLNPFVTENIDEVDVIFLTGDLANNKIPALNEPKMLDFLKWVNAWGKPVVGCNGNHCTSIWSGLISKEKIKEDFPNVTLLEHESYKLTLTKETPLGNIVNTYNIFGSPYTPTFGVGWAYNIKRGKLDNYWQEIPEDTDILITHGPPKGILDLTNESYGIVSVGDKSLLNHVHRVKPDYHIFSHLHDEKGIHNNGIFNKWGTNFVNTSIVNLKHQVINDPKIIKI